MTVLVADRLRLREELRERTELRVWEALIDGERDFVAVRLRVPDPSAELVLVALFVSEWIHVPDHDNEGEVVREAV